MRCWETLRSGAPPFRMHLLHRTGELDVEAVSEDVLLSALQTGPGRRRAAVSTWPPATNRRGSPNGLCAWCTDLPQCEPGQRRAGTNVPRVAGDADGDDDFALVATGLTGEGVGGR